MTLLRCKRFLFLPLAASLCLYAQEFRGTVLGRVTDPTGAVVPGASITATNRESGAVYTGQSNGDGNYTIPFVLPGAYTVVVEAAGFKSISRPGVIVQINDKIALDFALQVGQSTENVTVTAESPILEISTAEMGQVVDSKLIDRLPVDSDNPMNLVALAPGVLAGSGNQMSNTQNNISISGGSGLLSGNDITVDGIPNVNPRAGGLAVTAPSADAVQQFKVVTTMFDASNGRSNGGAIAFTTKSGTNTLHGTTFGYWANAEFNANGWQRNRLGLPRVPAGFQRWGGTAGGPIYLPKLYNGRNKTFFFFSYEQTGPNQSSTVYYGRVPTALERQGNFSQTLSTAGPALALYDPFTRGRNASNQLVSVPYPGAVLPAAELNVTGKAVMNLYPLPNLSGAARIGSFNWFGANTSEGKTPNLSTRIDQNFGSRDKVFFRFNRLTDYSKLASSAMPGGYQLYSAPGSTSNPEQSNRANMSAALDNTIVITPTLVASLRAGYTRTNLKGYYEGNSLNPGDMNLAPIIAANQVSPGYAQLIPGENVPGFGSAIRTSANDTYSFYATFNQLRGIHSFKYGSDVRIVRWNEANFGTSQNGRFNFTPAFTSQDPNTASTQNTSGTALASMLLGIPSSGSLGYTAPISIQSWYASGFLQDDIKLTARLTLNLGIRYELETPPTERYNRLGSFDPGAALPVQVPGYNLTGAIVFAGSNGQGRQNGKLDSNNFGPRVGFAYAVSPKWVIRGGYGIFYSSLLTNIAGFGQVNTTGLGAQSSFNVTTNYTATADGGLTPFTTLANPFPNGLSTPAGAGQGMLTNVGNSISIVSQDRVSPYIQQWQFSVQRQLGANLLASLAYVGSHALKLVGSQNATTGEYYNWNELSDQYQVPSLPGNVKVTNPFYKIFPSASTLGGTSTTTQGQLWARFPQFTTVNIYGMNGNNDLYHSLQAHLEKRFSHGFNLIANFTHSRNMFYDMSSLVNVRKYRTVAATDRPEIVTIFAVYELPVGRNRAFGSHLPRFFNALAGGWELAGSMNGSSGDPLTVTQTLGRPTATQDPVYHSSINDRLGDRINSATGLPTNPYFNTSVWQPLPNNYTATKEPPLLDWLRGPRKVYTNVSIFKSFALRESVHMELRGEIYNPFNSPVFGNPSTNMSNPASFGTITTAGGIRSLNFMAKLRF